MALTKKQRVFIEEYLLDFNATQAALRAGYSPRTACNIGSENLRKPYIAEAIQARIDEKAMKADEVLLRLADMGRGDIGDFMDISSMSFSLDLNKAKEAGLTHLIKKVKDRSVMTVNKDGEESETHYIEIELHDAKDALVQLGRHHVLFTDKKELTGKGGSDLFDVDAWLDKREQRKKSVEDIEECGTQDG